MSYVSPYKTFVFESYAFNSATRTLSLNYSFDGERMFKERVTFDAVDKNYNQTVFDALCFYVFIVAGTSYYKTFLAPEFVIKQGGLTQEQADFFNLLYRGGLSQFLYENHLRPENLATFRLTPEAEPNPQSYSGTGVLLMQSGGKDSLLAAELLKQAGHEFKSWHMSTTGFYPHALDMIGMPVSVATRQLDLAAISQARTEGGLNGHIPFSALFGGYALIAAVLQNKSLVIAANESSADEANVEVNGFTVNHQFSKTYAFELALQEYVHQNVSADLNYGSILRPFTEVRVAELFAQYAWRTYRNVFSSCNLANYKQGEDKGDLKWDGTCPKCANAFLLFAPFVDNNELLELFNGKNLLQSPDMTETYRQLLGLSDIKPFECVGTFDEMKLAYHMAHMNNPEYTLPGVKVPNTDLDYKKLHEHQPFFDELIDYSNL